MDKPGRTYQELDYGYEGTVRRGIRGEPAHCAGSAPDRILVFLYTIRRTRDYHLRAPMSISLSNKFARRFSRLSPEPGCAMSAEFHFRSSGEGKRNSSSASPK